MHTPTTSKKNKVPSVRTERKNTRTGEAKPNVRPAIAKMIRKVVNENAATWEELAKL